jgi:hypothetical protein
MMHMTDLHRLPTARAATRDTASKCEDKINIALQTEQKKLPEPETESDGNGIRSVDKQMKRKARGRKMVG